MNQNHSGNNRSGVVYADYEDGISHLASDRVAMERENAHQLDTKRSRICFHRDSKDPIHEMMITFHKDTYVRPHKHLSKTESYLVIDGEIEIVFFDDNSGVKKRVIMGAFASGKDFYLKSISDEWHTVLIKSEYATILEITNGPFVANDCLFAEWAPEIFDKLGIEVFMKKYS